MKFNILNKAILNLSKVHAVHSIPGRLRVKIPGLKLAKDIISPEEIQNLFENYRLKGVNSLDVNFISSKALITYDESTTNSEHILAFLNRLRAITFEHFSEQGKITKDIINKVVNSLKEEGYEFEGK